MSASAGLQLVGAIQLQQARDRQNQLPHKSERRRHRVLSRSEIGCLDHGQLVLWRAPRDHPLRSLFYGSLLRHKQPPVRSSGSFFGVASVGLAAELAHGMRPKVGCGLGGGARCLTALLCPAAYVAVDYSAASVARGRRRHLAAWSASLPVEYRVVDATSLAESFQHESFDVALMVQSAHAVVDARRMCDGLAHVLRPGGRLLLADHFRERRWRDLQGRLADSGLVLGESEDITDKAAFSERIPDDMQYVLARFENGAALYASVRVERLMRVIVHVERPMRLSCQCFPGSGLSAHGVLVKDCRICGGTCDGRLASSLL